MTKKGQGKKERLSDYYGITNKKWTEEGTKIVKEIFFIHKKTDEVEKIFPDFDKKTQKRILQFTLARETVEGMLGRMKD